VNAFLVDVFMASSAIGSNSNYLAAPGEEPSPISSSFNLCALGEHMVVGFLAGIFFL
jgi:hypothetical protein